MGDRTLAVLSPLLAGTFFSRVMAGFTEQAALAGYRVLGMQTLDAGRMDLDREHTAPDVVHRVGWEHACAMAVLVSAVRPAYLREVLRTGKPVVTVSHEIPGIACPIVSPENRSAMQDAVQHLIDHGHRRVAFIGNLAQDDLAERHDAYREVLVRNGIEPDEDLLVHVKDNVETGGQLAARTLLEAGMPCTAVVAATDYNALGAMEVWRAAGLELPRDLAVVSFDDIEEASSARPALSTVHQDFALVGATAARLLIDQVEGREVPPGHYRVPTRFVPRESCGCGPALSTAAFAPGLAREEAAVVFARRLVQLLVPSGAAPADLAHARASAAELAELLEHPDEAAAGTIGELAGRLAGGVTRWEVMAGLIGWVRAFAGVLGEGAPAKAAVERERLATELGLELSRALLSREGIEKAKLGQSMREEYRLSLELLQRGDHDPRGLHFLARTPIDAGCLGLWKGGDPRSGVLEVASTYSRDGTSLSDVGAELAVTAFPPAPLMARVGAAAADLAIVVPVRTVATDWGLLALVGQLERTAVTGRDFYFQCAALLSAALEDEALLTSLRDQREELRRQRQELEQRQGELAERQEELRRSEERYALAATAASDALWDWDLRADEIYFSERWKEVIGVAADEVGTGPDEWFNRIHPEDRPELERVVARCLAGEADSLVSEHRLRCSEGTYRWMRCRALAVPGAPSPAERLVGSMTDITVQRELEQRLRHQALHDALTGLPNRSLVLDRMEQMLTAARRYHEKVACLFIDVDDFKEVNDSLGHAAGDALLVEMAARLRATVRDADTVGRLGGDEFVVLVEERRLPRGAVEIAERIADALQPPFDLLGREHMARTSIGVASTENGSADELLRDADVAMYQAKAAGKNRYVVFRPEMRREAEDRLRLELDLTAGIALGQLRVFYQPIVHLEDLEIWAMEALVRWQHPERGLLAPAAFIPIAESNGRLILDLERFVLKSACRSAMAWRGSGRQLAVSVNITVRHLEGGELVMDVREALAESGLEPERLVLELTEAAIVADAARAAPRLRELKELGVRIAIDDFGTGYSSLAYLRQLAVDIVKIDRSFIGSIPQSLEAWEVVKTLIYLGRTLEVEVVAEGIELEGQLEALQMAGCDHAQGFLFTRPMDGDHVDAFMAARPAPVAEHRELADDAEWAASH